MPSVTSDIRNRIRTTIETLDPPVGIVHHYQRWTADDSTLQAIARDPITGTIRVWMVTREGSPGEREAPAEAHRYPVYVVHAYRAWNDAAESEPAPAQPAKAEAKAEVAKSEFNKYYTVKKGDTLYSLAKRFNVTARVLSAWNNLKVKVALKPGKRIIVAKYQEKKGAMVKQSG